MELRVRATLDPLLMPLLEEMLPGGKYEWLTGKSLAEGMLTQHGMIDLLRVPGGQSPVIQGVKVVARFLPQGATDEGCFAMPTADLEALKKRLDRPLEDALFPSLFVMVNSPSLVAPAPRWIGLTMTRDLVDYFTFGTAGEHYIDRPAQDGVEAERWVFWQKYRALGPDLLDRTPFLRVWIPPP